MTRIELAPEVADDFERIRDHLSRHGVQDAAQRLRQIIDAISALEQNPLIGRPARNGCRELIIGRDARGYVALYRYVESIDTVFVLAIRSQREAGFTRD
ncbi:MAG TPA: type II toxin-antitoxin system RelE/ParE family toxin [Telluria sp.]|nr:type II toxin-antitoxin system RelE/ParE family toxin [Telluria sp.]